MKKIAALIAWVCLAATPAHAITLFCGVEKTDVEGKIGVRISTFGRIQKVHPGSPAEEAGLQKDDVVKSVDGKKDAVEQISGEPGTKVHLVVKRGRQRFEIDVERIDVRMIAYHGHRVTSVH